jgi:hypothetical protein
MLTKIDGSDADISPRHTSRSLFSPSVTQLLPFVIVALLYLLSKLELLIAVNYLKAESYLNLSREPEIERKRLSRQLPGLRVAYWGGISTGQVSVWGKDIFIVLFKNPKCTRALPYCGSILQSWFVYAPIQPLVYSIRIRAFPYQHTRSD